VATSEATFVATSARVATGWNPEVVRPHHPFELGNPRAVPVDQSSLVGDDGQERVGVAPEMPCVLRASELLPDRAAPIVTYCSNPACPNSQRVADRLTALGYTHVRKYREGIEDWVSAGLPTESGVLSG